MTDIDRIVNFKAGDKSGVASIEAAAIAAKGMGREVAAAKTATETLNDALQDMARSSKISAIAKDAARYATETGNARTAQAKLNAELTKANATQSEINRAARAYHTEIGNITREMARQEESAKRVKETVGKYGGKFGREQFGDISTSLSSIGSVTGAFGSNAPTELLRLGGDSFGVAEYMGRFKVSLKEAGEQAAASTGLIGNLATGLQSTAPGLTASAAGLASIALVALPFAASIVAIGAVLAIVTQRANEAREASRKAAEATIEGLNAEQQARFLAERQRFDELQQRIDAEREAGIIGANSLNAYREKIAKLNDVFKNFRTEGAAAGYSNRQQIVDEIARINEDMAGLAETTAHAQTRLKSLTDVQEEYAQQIKESEALKNLAVSEKELETVRHQHGAAIAQLKQQEDDLNAAYTRSVLTRSAARGRADFRENEDRDITAKRKQADLERTLAQQQLAHNKNLETIAKRGADAILAARNDLAKREADAVKQIASIQEAYRRDEAKAQAAFAKQQARDLADFRRDERRAQRDYRQSQLENLINNDVTGTILDEMAFNTDRRQGRQDFRRDRNRGQADFDAERQAALAASLERIAQIQQELVEYRAATETKIAQIQAQTAADLETAQLAYDEKLRLDQEQRDLLNAREAEDLKLKLDRRTQDRQSEDAAAAAALQSSLGKIAEQKTAQDAALDSAIAKANAFKLVVESIKPPGSTSTTLPPWVQNITAPYIPTPGSDQFYEKPKPLPVAPAPKSNTGGGGFGTGFAGISSANGMGRGGGQTIIVNINGQPGGGSNKPLVDAIVLGVQQAINNPQVRPA